MDVHDLPMVLFTVVTQMSVGTFLTLGVVQLFARRRHSAETLDRVISPVLYAIGPVLVFGFAVSMLHMHDITNVFNVVRHVESSWLSREIVFGMLFAAAGFAFAALEWFKVGSSGLRQTVAALAAVLGVILVVSESSVYYSVVTVPAWNTWVVPVQVFGTTALLGVLAVGAAMMVTTAVRTAKAEAQASTSDAPDASSHDAGSPDAAPSGSGGLMLQVRTRVREINAPTSVEEWRLTAAILRAIAFVGSFVAVGLLVIYPIYLGILSEGGAAGEASAQILTGQTLVWRLVLLAAAALILGLFVYRMAQVATRAHARTLAALVLLSFLLAFVSECLGRWLHYAMMIRVGI